MRISELVDELQHIMEKHGDIEILLCGSFGPDLELTVDGATLLIE